MLVNFKVSNFLSFSDEQSLSMVPSLGEDGDLIKIDEIRLLKSRYFRRQFFRKKQFHQSDCFRKETCSGRFCFRGQEKFSKILSENKGKESFFEYTFYSRGRFYSYGFAFVLHGGKLKSEYLYEIESDDEERLIFSRSENGFTWGETSGSVSEMEKKLREEPDRLLVSLAAPENEDLAAVRGWFSDKLLVNFQEQEFLRLESGLMKTARSSCGCSRIMTRAFPKSASGG